MKRVLVTGATGFLGTPCLPRLAARGFEVHGISRRSRQDGVRWHQADLLDPGATYSLLETVRPTHLLHLAWAASGGHHSDDPGNLDWVTASVRLVEAFGAVNGQRLVFAGTCAEYLPSPTPCREDTTPLRPPSLYGACKAALATLVPAYASKLGIASCSWARLFHPYGPGDRAARFIPTLVETLHRREPMACTNGHQRRDFMYVDDTVEALARLVDSDLTGPINIASGEPVAVRAFVTEIASQMNRLDLVEFGARPASGLDEADLVADVARQNEELGYRPSLRVKDGVWRTLDWYRSGGRFHE